VLVLDDKTALTWPRFAVFFFGTLAVALLVGVLTPLVLGDTLGVPVGMLLSLAGAAALFHLSFRR
jgi:hypothetical protein